MGDGTTSVIVLTGEMLAVAEPFLAQQMHPTVIIKAYRRALEDLVHILEDNIRSVMWRCCRRLLKTDGVFVRRNSWYGKRAMLVVSRVGDNYLDRELGKNKYIIYHKDTKLSNFRLV